MSEVEAVKTTAKDDVFVYFARLFNRSMLNIPKLRKLHCAAGSRFTPNE